MKCKVFFMAIAFIAGAIMPGRAANEQVIEVTGTSTVNIVPDRITLEIGIEEYYKPSGHGDSTLVRLQEIEKDVRDALKVAGVDPSSVTISSLGNYRNRNISENLLLAEQLSAIVNDFAQIERIADKVDRRGISSFTIGRIDNTEMERFNRDGLKAALDAAREKAQFMAENEGVVLTGPLEIQETGPSYYDMPVMSNVSFDSGAGMENIRRIVRRYSVKVRYCFMTKAQQQAYEKSSSN